MEQIVESPKGSDSPGNDGSNNPSKHIIDTAAPIESVKDAVSKFGGKLGWRGLQTQSLERSKLEGQDFGKPDNTEELESIKKLIEELKVKLEKVEREEGEAKQEVEIASLKIEEMEQDIVNEASIEANIQVETEKARHAAAVSDLEIIRRELDSLNKEYASMVSERDIAVKKSEEAVAESEEVEKELEDLAAELIATKESLESTRAAQLDAEEQRLRVVDEETRNLKVEFEQAEEEFQRLNQQVSSAMVLKSKLDASSSLLLDLKAELAAYMESKIKEEGIEEERKKELEELKLNIEKANAEVNSLREASESLKSKLELEKSLLIDLKQSEETASAAVLTLREELEKTRSAIACLKMKEEEARDMMIELPKKLQQAAQDADEAKSLAQAAQQELVEAQEEAEQAKARASTLETRLVATQMEIEASNVSKRLAKESISALEKSESSRSNNDMDYSNVVTITLDEYHELSKRSYKAEEQAKARVAAANSQIEMAKESELRSLERLEELNEELAVRRESLNIAAEKARQGKLAVEDELRTWKTEQEQQRNDMTTIAAATSTDPVHDLLSSKDKTPPNDGETGSAPDTKSNKKKKKSLFPSKVVMFFTKRKTHPTK
ncbi:hypothetical protein TanjilG_03759 [Lupinus angustifolius]|uniref:WEB family protein n=1 Tax=Lupinus angustifolius TaxID=3871 RepID=A0A1J7GW32_LUPAN|nr:PREDICTED: protein WEAK CHLOROPLAST MOVEMENT UNDER BLUE LIGHT 1-like [Lupinus angustifolius]OIV93796.1 hypothetical protein TanjilG_03759 [Lupinus angustifolius]